MKVAEAEILAREERWTDADALVDELRRLHGVSAARYLPPAADRLAGHAALARGAVGEGKTLLGAAAAGYDASGMVVHAAVTRLDLAEASPDARGLVEAALPAVERTGYLRELARAKRLR